MSRLTYKSPNGDYYIDLAVDDSNFRVSFRPVDSSKRTDENVTEIEVDLDEDQLWDVQKTFDKLGVQH